MLRTIIVETEVITPMFLSGADGTSAELRAPSIKGLLRFWWRATQAEGEKEDLKTREGEIFGNTGQGAKFSIKLEHDSLKPVKTELPSHKIPVLGKTYKADILKYLAYGTYDSKGSFNKERIPEGTKMRLYMNVFKNDCENEILLSLYLLDLFGGLGSRSRNGFGGIGILNRSETFKTLKSRLSLENPYTKANLEKLMINSPAQSYPSFATGTKVFRSKTRFPTWDKALAEVGKIYRNARLDLESKHVFDKRQYLGAPIVEKKITRSFLERHGKPYFLKLAKEEQEYRAYILYLPSRYCDGLDEDREGHKVDHSQVNIKFKSVCDEFNALLGKDLDTII